MVDPLVVLRRREESNRIRFAILNKSLSEGRIFDSAHVTQWIDEGQGLICRYRLNELSLTRTGLLTVYYDAEHIVGGLIVVYHVVVATDSRWVLIHYRMKSKHSFF